MASDDRRRVLSRAFYERDPASVAQDLLGKKLIRRVDADWLEGKIVETEAYFGVEDPASRAYHGLKNYNRLMWSEPGRVFIYNVHRYWMFNVVAHLPHQVGAVLVRAVEPIKGVERMQRNRPVTRLRDLTNGPGKLTIAFAIDQRVNGVSVTAPRSEVIIVDGALPDDVGSSPRIGVAQDLTRDLRFYAKACEFVSRIH